MKPPNIILITSDQQRFDSLGCTGNAAAQTPHLDRLAERGGLFRNHFVTNPVCSPSRGSFMSGLYPCENGLWSNGCALPTETPTLASVLAGARYQTAHVGKLHLVPILDRVGPHPAFGFQHLEVGEGDQMYPCDDHMNHVRQADPLGYVDYMTELYAKGHARGYTSRLPEPLHHSTWVTDRSLDWLQHQRDRSAPFFLNVGYFDPHHAFNPIDPWASRFDDVEVPMPFHDPGAIDTRPPHYHARYRSDQKTLNQPGVERAIARAYHAMVAHLDHCVGRLLAGLEALGLLENTVIVFTSDHGEMLGHHGMLHKGPFLLDDLMRVPMIMAAPGLEPGQAFDGLTSMVDLMPTFAALAGVDSPTPHGRRLVGCNGQALPDGSHEAVFAQWENDATRGPARSLRMVRTATHKLVRYAEDDTGELYDLAEDPHEARNLFGQPNADTLTARLSDRLEPQIRQARPDTPRSPGW
ncbi:MAG: sulfatase-like hydrolase/transferase [Planctomycetota bacterium]